MENCSGRPEQQQLRTFCTGSSLASTAEFSGGGLVCCVPGSLHSEHPYFRKLLGLWSQTIKGASLRRLAAPGGIAAAHSHPASATHPADIMHSPGTPTPADASASARASTASSKRPPSSARVFDSNTAATGAAPGQTEAIGSQLQQQHIKHYEQQHSQGEYDLQDTKHQQLHLIQQLQQQQQVMLQMLQAATGGSTAIRRTESGAVSTPAAAASGPWPSFMSEITPAEDLEDQHASGTGTPAGGVYPPATAVGHAVHVDSPNAVTVAASPSISAATPAAQPRQPTSSSTTHSPTETLHGQQQRRHLYLSHYDETTEYDPFTQSDVASGTSSSNSLLTAAAAGFAVGHDVGQTTPALQQQQQQQQLATVVVDIPPALNRVLEYPAAAAVHARKVPPLTTAAQLLCLAALDHTWPDSVQEVTETSDNDDLDDLVNHLADDQSSIAALTDLYLRRASLAGSEVEPLLHRLPKPSDDLLQSIDEQHFSAWQQQQQHAMNREQRLLQLLKNLNLSPGGRHAAAAYDSPCPAAAAEATGTECFSPRHPGTPRVPVLPPPSPSTPTAAAAAAADQAARQHHLVQGNAAQPHSAQSRQRQQKLFGRGAAAAAKTRKPPRAPSVSSSTYSLSLWDRSFLPSSRMGAAAAGGSRRQRDSRHKTEKGQQQQAATDHEQQQQQQLTSSVSKWCSRAGLDWQLDLAAAAAAAAAGKTADILGEDDGLQAATGAGLGLPYISDREQLAAGGDASTAGSDVTPDHVSRASLAFTDTCWPEHNHRQRRSHNTHLQQQQQQQAAGRGVRDSSWLTRLLWPVPEDKEMIHSPGRLHIAAAQQAAAAAAHSDESDVVGLLLRSLAAPAAAEFDHSAEQQQQHAHTDTNDASETSSAVGASALNGVEPDKQDEQQQEAAGQQAEDSQQQQLYQLLRQQQLLATLLASTSTFDSLDPDATATAAAAAETAAEEEHSTQYGDHRCQQQHQQQQQQQGLSTPARSLVSAVTLSPPCPGRLQVYEHTGADAADDDDTGAVTEASLNPERVAALMQNPLFEPVERLIRDYTSVTEYTTAAGPAAAANDSGSGCPDVSAAAAATALAAIVNNLSEQQWESLNSNVLHQLELQHLQEAAGQQEHQQQQQQQLSLDILDANRAANAHTSSIPSSSAPPTTAAGVAGLPGLAGPAPADDVLGRLLMDLVELNRLLQNCHSLDADAIQQLQNLLPHQTGVMATQDVQAAAILQQQRQQQHGLDIGVAGGLQPAHGQHAQQHTPQHQQQAPEQQHPRPSRLPLRTQRTAASPAPTARQPTTQQMAAQPATGLAPVKTSIAIPLDTSGMTSGDNVLLGSPAFSRASRQTSSSSSKALQEFVQGNPISAAAAGSAAAAVCYGLRSEGWLLEDAPQSTPPPLKAAADAAVKGAAAAAAVVGASASEPDGERAGRGGPSALPVAVHRRVKQQQRQQPHQHLVAHGAITSPGQVAAASSQHTSVLRTSPRHIYKGVAALPVSTAGSPGGMTAAAAAVTAAATAAADDGHQAAMVALRERVRRQLQTTQQPQQRQRQSHAGQFVDLRKAAVAAASRQSKLSEPTTSQHTGQAPAAHTARKTAAVPPPLAATSTMRRKAPAPQTSSSALQLSTKRHGDEERFFDAVEDTIAASAAGSGPSSPAGMFTPAGAAGLAVTGDSDEDDLLAGIGPVGPDNQARMPAQQPEGRRSVSADSVESLEALSLGDLRELLSRVARASLNRLQKQQQQKQQHTSRHELSSSVEVPGAPHTQAESRDAQQQQLQQQSCHRESEGSSAVASSFSFRHLAAADMATAVESRPATGQQQHQSQQLRDEGGLLLEDTPRPRAPLQQQPVIKNPAAARAVSTEVTTPTAARQLQCSTAKAVGERGALPPIATSTAAAPAPGSSSIQAPGLGHRSNAAVGRASLVQALQILTNNSPRGPAAGSPRAACRSPMHAADNSSVPVSISRAPGVALSSPVQGPHVDEIQLASLSLSELSVLLRAARVSQQRKGQSVPDELVSKAGCYQQGMMEEDRQQEGSTDAEGHKPRALLSDDTAGEWSAAVNATVQPSP